MPPPVVSPGGPEGSPALNFRAGPSGGQCSPALQQTCCTRGSHRAAQPRGGSAGKAGPGRAAAGLLGPSADPPPAPPVGRSPHACFTDPISRGGAAGRGGSPRPDGAPDPPRCLRGRGAPAEPLARPRGAADAPPRPPPPFPRPGRCRTAGRSAARVERSGAARREAPCAPRGRWRTSRWVRSGGAAGPRDDPRPFFGGGCLVWGVRGMVVVRRRGPPRALCPVRVRNFGLTSGEELAAAAAPGEGHRRGRGRSGAGGCGARGGRRGRSGSPRGAAGSAQPALLSAPGGAGWPRVRASPDRDFLGGVVVVV